MEAMVFLTVIFIGIERDLNRSLTMRDVKSMHGKVRVYGDDIIVPTHNALTVIEVLEAFGFKVNTNKSFWTGKFRESCGAEYYDGHNVSVTRLRHLPPRSQRHAREILSLVSVRNHFYIRGLLQYCEFLDSIIEPILGIFPRMVPDFNSVSYTGEVGTGSPLLGKFDWGEVDISHHDRKLHRPLVKGYVAFSPKPRSAASGEGSMLKVFLRDGCEPIVDPQHLERAGRPKSVGIRLRKVPVNL
jgi:hypothetical protein